MSLFRCPACHLPITDTEIQNGECGCGHKLVVNSASLSKQSTRKQVTEHSTMGTNLVLLGVIGVFVAALSFGLWRMSVHYDNEPETPTKAPK